MPCSCIAATYESETVAAIPSKPGNPMWPAGSSESRSGLPLFACEQSELPREQWTPMPTKSANAWPGFDLTSAASVELAPKTVGMSVAMFSSTVFAVATWPTLQPARVYGTHGAGALLPSAVSMLNLGSVGVEVVGSNSGSVQ